MGLRRGDGHHVEAPWIQRTRNAADVAALARRVPAFIAENHGDLLAVYRVVQLSQPLLQLLELLAVFFVVQGRGEVYFRELLHLQQGEFLVEGLADVSAVLQAFVDHLYQQLQRVAGSLALLVSVQNMPLDRLSGLLHELVIGLAEDLILTVLPEIVLCHPPFGFIVFPQGVEPLALLVLVNMQEELQNQIAAVAQLTLEFVDRADPFLILFLGDVTAEELPHRALHPAGVIEHDLAVLRDRLGILIQEGIALFLLRQHHRGDDVVEAGIDLADQLVDEAALSGSGPAFDQHDDRQFLVADQLLLRQKPLPQRLDLSLQGCAVFIFGAFELF